MLPVVVLTGFLGSGKTSLLNRWLAIGGGRAPGGGRLALVVNELGSVGIDGDLLPPGLARQVELAGGCVCCQLDEDLARTLGELAAREPDVELVLIETTGVADPLPIGWTLARPPLDRQVRLAAVVTVIDATLHLASRSQSPAVDAQVDGADVLAVAKLDLLPGGAASIEPLVQHLTQRNPEAALVLGSPDDVAAELWALMADPPAVPARVVRAPGGLRVVTPHGLDAVSLPVVGTLDFEELTAALEALPATVVRVKGIAEVVDRTTGSDRPRLIAFHRVGARVSSEELVGPCDHRIVAIGRGIDAGRLAACLRASMLR